MNLKALVVVIPSLLAAVPCLAQPALIIPDITAIGQPSLVAPEITAIGQNSTAGQPNSSQEILVQPAPAPAQAPPQQSASDTGTRRFRIGPEVGLFVPTKNVIRSRFGNDWFSLGIGLGQFDAAPVTGQWNADIELLANARGSNAAYLLPIGPEYRIGLIRGKSVTPYLAASADVVPTYVHSATDNVPYGFRTAWSGGLFGGLDFAGGSAQLEGGYRWFTDVDDYDFSGAEVTLGLRF